MPSHRILQINALATAACGAAMLAARGVLPGLFGLGTPYLLDGVALGLLAYAAALWVVAARAPVSRRALLVFTAADALWVGASVLVLLLFWDQLAPVARTLVIAVGLAVDAFATLQYLAARAVAPARPLLT